MIILTTAVRRRFPERGMNLASEVCNLLTEAFGRLTVVSLPDAMDLSGREEHPRNNILRRYVFIQKSKGAKQRGKK